MSLHRKAILLTATLAIPMIVGSASPAALGATGTSCGHTPSDFNGDGRADVATAEPYRTVGGLADAGALRVIYGGQAGLVTTGNQILDEASFPTLKAASESDHFGISAASGYFNSDCYGDLAIGVPGAAGGVGAVIIVYGSANGLDPSTATEFTPTSIEPSATGKQKFGWSLASGDFNGDGSADLAIGAIAHGGFAGGVDVLYATPSGLENTNAQLFSEATAGIPGTATKGDQFGYAVASGDFDGDGTADLAIGVPGKELSKAKEAGMVITLAGSAAGLQSTTARYWRQGLGGIASTPELGDQFGFSLATGSISGHTWDDLAVGAPGEGIGAATAAGSVQVIRGSASGLTGSGSETETQHNPQIPGEAEKGDQFGWSVTMGDYNGDRHADLAIGTPYEDLGTALDAGNVTVLYGTAAGITTSHAQAWSQDSTGITGGAETKDVFGYSLQSLPIAGPLDDLVAGDPGEDSSGFINSGALAVIMGTTHGLSAADNQLLGPASLAGGAQNFAKMGVRIG